MADLEKTIEIIFSGVDNLSSSVGSVNNSLTNLESKVMSVAEPLASAANSILKLDAALVAMAVGGLVLATKTAGDFGGQFSEITTLISDTGAPIEQFKTDILNYSATSVKSIEDINGALYAAISAGVGYKDSIAFVNEAEKLSVAGKAALSETTKVLISTLNAYGESTDKAGKYSDIMFTTVKLGQTTFSELSSSLAQVTGLASTSGISFETLSAAIAALTVAGLPTSQAITGLKQTIQNIIKPSSEAEKAAELLGIQFNSTALQTKGLEGVLWEAYKATGGNVGKMGELFGSVESLNAVMILGADKTGKFKQALAEMANSTGATSIAYAKMADDFANINQKIANNFDLILILIGDKILPQYGELAGSISKLFAGLQIEIDAGTFDPLFDEIKKAGAALTLLIDDIAKNLPEAFEQVDFTGLLDALGEVGKSIKGMFSGLDLSTPEGLAKVIQNVIDTLESLAYVTSGMFDAFKPFINAILGAIDSFNKMDEEQKKQAGNILGYAKAFTDAGLKIGLALVLIGDSADKFSYIFGEVIAVLIGFKDLGVTIFDGLKLTFIDVVEKILWVAEKLSKIPGLGYFSEDIKELQVGIKEWGEDVEQHLGDAATSAFENLTGIKLGFEKVAGSADLAVSHIQFIPAELAKIPKNTEIGIIVSATGADADEIKKILAGIETEKQVNITAVAKIEQAMETLSWFDNEGKEHKILVPVSTTGITEAKNSISTIPDSKTLEVQLKGDIETKVAQIKASADIAQSAFEWTAKVNIAEAEATAKVTQQAFESAGVSVTALASSTANMFSSLTSNMDKLTKSQKWDFFDILKEQQDEQKGLIKSQIELTSAQADYIKEKTKALNKGQSVIEIDSTGLEPALEMVMWQIIEKVQIKATAEAADFLLGI
jgi:TP901 family phage tail tape measure protein